LGLDYDDVEFPNAYKQTLRGWFVPAANPLVEEDIIARAESEEDLVNSCIEWADDTKPKSGDFGIVLVHGGGRDRRAFLRHVPIFTKYGIHVLLFDFSEHGISDGTRCGFSYGIREKDDVCSAVKWMKKEKGLKHIVAMGTSVGGSAVIMAALKSPHIEMVIAENPVSSAEEFAIYHLKKMLSAYLPDYVDSWVFTPFYAFLTRVFLWRLGALFGYTRPFDAVPKLSPKPLFLMHGTVDDLVPPSHSEVLFARAVENSELWLAKDAWHCALYDKYPEEYTRRVIDFISKHYQRMLNERSNKLKKSVTFQEQEENTN